MVRTVASEQTQVESFVDSVFESGCSVQIGLLVGRLGVGSARDLVFALIPTPQNDGEDPAVVASSSTETRGGRKGGKGKPVVDSSSIQVDVEWVSEHARQVSRMLVGGMYVVGIYVFGTEGAFKNSQLVLWEVVRAVAASVSSELQGSDILDMLLLHISSSPRRLSCRSCALETSFSSTLLRPCEWKPQKVVGANLQYFSASYRFNFRIPVLGEGKQARKSLKDKILASVSLEATRLKTARVLLNGVPADLDADVRPDSRRDKPHVVDFLLPWNTAKCAPGVGDRHRVCGFLSLCGTVTARAVGYTKEPLARVIAYLKDDIVVSLRSRLELLWEEAEQSGDGENSAQKSLQHLLGASDIPASSEYACCAFPQRVFIPWLDAAVVCDYLLPNETLQDVKDRCGELLGMTELRTSEILQPEALASTSATTQQNEKEPVSCASPDPVLALGPDGVVNATCQLPAKHSQSITRAFWIGTVFTFFLSFALAYFLAW